MGEAKRKADEETLDKLMQVQRMFAAKARDEGRLRITSSSMNAVGPHSRLAIRQEPNGDLVVTYLGDGTA